MFSYAKCNFFVISCSLGLPCILLMYLSVPILTIHNTLTITGTVVILRCHVFSISILRSLYLLILFYSFTKTLLSVGIGVLIGSHDFLLKFLTTTFGLSLFILFCLNSKVPEKSYSFGFSYWFWLVFIPFYSI